MRQRTQEELPVLTDLVIDDIESTSLPDRVNNAITTNVQPAWASQPQQPWLLPAPVVSPVDTRNSIAPDESAFNSTHGPNAANVDDPFNAQLLVKLKELQHDVYSQVMQQLEIYVAGSLKDHVRDMLLPMLTDITQQVADETSTQIREVVSKTVDFEFTRLREQLFKAKDDRRT